MNTSPPPIHTIIFRLGWRLRDWSDKQMSFSVPHALAKTSGNLIQQVNFPHPFSAALQVEACYDLYLSTVWEKRRRLIATDTVGKTSHCMP